MKTFLTLIAIGFLTSAQAQMPTPQIPALLYQDFDKVRDELTTLYGEGNPAHVRNSPFSFTFWSLPNGETLNIGAETDERKVVSVTFTFNLVESKSRRHKYTTQEANARTYAAAPKVPAHCTYPDPYTVTVESTAFPENPTKAEAIAEDVYYDLSDIDAKDLRSIAIADGSMY
jgi:hypothetical protein